MSNEEIVDEILHEAEEFRIRKDVIDMMSMIMEKNPNMERVDAVKIAFEHIKLHSGLNYRK
jgi:hypothetical protein